MDHVQLEFEDINREPKKFPICILSNGIKLAKNIGSVFRVGEAFGVEKIIIEGLNEKLPNKKFSRVARSTEQFIEYEQSDDLVNNIHRLKAQGYTVVGLEITSSSRLISDVDFLNLEKIALIIGAEVEGIDKRILDEVDFCVHIPMYGVNLSMNVTHALGIALYEITRQKNS